MSAVGSVTPLSHTRLWLSPVQTGPQTRLYRYPINLAQTPGSAEITLTAESTYHLWVNGAYLGRGPAFHHPDYWPLDRYDLSPHLRAGKNVVAVLVHSPMIPIHNGVPSGYPGLSARISVDGKPLPDSAWKITAETGWSSDVPRRGWATGYVEYFDAGKAPANWQSADFDDSRWATPEVSTFDGPLKSAVEEPSPIPPLRYSLAAPVKVLSTFSITDPPPALHGKMGSADYGTALLKSEWLPLDAGISVSAVDPKTGALTVKGLSPDRGAIVLLDLGAEYVGNIVFDANCDSAGVMDVAWCEFLQDGRPALLLKGTTYSDRYVALPGQNRREGILFSGMRYLCVFLRNFTGTVAFTRLGVRASEPDLSFSAKFESSDPRLDSVWAMCERSLRVGTQEGVMDCPTREQAPYVGDGHPVSRWITQLTGDARHWQYLTAQQFRRQAANGMVRSSVYTGSNAALVDYPLLGIVGARDYWQFTGDFASVSPFINAYRKTFTWFDEQLDADGVCVTNWKLIYKHYPWEAKFDPAEPKIEGEGNFVIFIDHPGLGWHNQNEPGIDRSGTNAAINAMLVLARRALADIEEAVGNTAEAARQRSTADKLAKKLFERFFDETRGYFADGRAEDGSLLKQISEQTNTICIAAGACDDERGRDILSRLLVDKDPAIARNGPYFWYYLFPLLAKFNLHSLALEKIRTLWGQMLDKGATTVWETFAGDHLDTWCHPWAAAPIEFLSTQIAGLPATITGTHTTLRPRTDLLPSCKASLVTLKGPVFIEWSNGQLKGSLPPGITAELITPDGKSKRVTGAWTS